MMHQGFGPTTPANIWHAPSDWPSLSDCADGNIELLVSDLTLATYAFVVNTNDASQYRIDWGDGTVTNYASGATAQHTYTIGAGTACSRGYTTFKVTISAPTNSIGTFCVTPHSLSLDTSGGEQNAQSHAILSAVIRATAATSLAWAFSENITSIYPGVRCYHLESCVFVGNFSALTTIDDMFYDCYTIASVTFAPFPALTSAIGVFEFCYALTSVIFPSLPSLVDAHAMFEYCAALQSVVFPALPSLQIAWGMFYQCYSLTSVTFPSLPALVDATNMFYQCSSLQSITLPALPNLTTATGMFSSNQSGVLKSITLPSLPSLTNATNMFYQGYCLQTITLPALPALTNATAMFYMCESLYSITITSLPVLANATNMFSWCSNLTAITLPTLPALTTATGMFNSCHTLAAITLSGDFGGTNVVRADSMLLDCQQLINPSFPNTKFSVVNAAGISGALNKLQSLTFSASSTFLYGTQPVIDVSYTTMTAAQINALFTELPTVTGSQVIRITGSTGAGTCTQTIATGKGWTVNAAT